MFTPKVKRDGVAPSYLLWPRHVDAAGQAALLLAESTLHVLMEAGVLTQGQALDAVRTAAEVKGDVGKESAEPRDTMRQSLDLLRRIERSMVAINGTTT